jgi:hypothetical protein
VHCDCLGCTNSDRLSDGLVVHCTSAHCVEPVGAESRSWVPEEGFDCMDHCKVPEETQNVYSRRDFAVVVHLGKNIPRNLATDIVEEGYHSLCHDTAAVEDSHRREVALPDSPGLDSTTFL